MALHALIARMWNIIGEDVIGMPFATTRVNVPQKKGRQKSFYVDTWGASEFFSPTLHVGERIDCTYTNYGRKERNTLFLGMKWSTSHTFQDHHCGVSRIQIAMRGMKSLEFHMNSSLALLLTHVNCDSGPINIGMAQSRPLLMY